MTHLIQRVGHNPDDLKINIADRPDMEMLAQGIFPSEILLGQLMADDDRLRPAGTVVAGEKRPLSRGICNALKYPGSARS